MYKAKELVDVLHQEITYDDIAAFADTDVFKSLFPRDYSDFRKWILGYISYKKMYFYIDLEGYDDSSAVEEAILSLVHSVDHPDYWEISSRVDAYLYDYEE